MCHITNEVELQSYTALYRSQSKAAGCGPVIFHSKIKARTSWTKYIERRCVFGNECRAKWGCFFCCCKSGSGVGTVYSTNMSTAQHWRGRTIWGTKNKNSQGSDLELWESAGKGRREEALTKYQQPNNESCAAIWKEIKPGSRETCKQAHEICYEVDFVFKGFFQGGMMVLQLLIKN